MVITNDESNHNNRNKILLHLQIVLNGIVKYVINKLTTPPYVALQCFS